MMGVRDRPSCSSISADGPGECETIHSGHVAVGDDEKTPAGAPLGKRLPSVGGRLHAKPQHCELTRQQATIGRMVIDDQHRPTFVRSGHGRTDGGRMVEHVLDDSRQASRRITGRLENLPLLTIQLREAEQLQHGLQAVERSVGVPRLFHRRAGGVGVVTDHVALLSPGGFDARRRPSGSPASG